MVTYSWGEAKNDATVLGVGTFSESQKIDGVIGGFQTGYNYQFGTWVWGFETDIQASGQKGGFHRAEGAGSRAHLSGFFSRQTWRGASRA